MNKVNILFHIVPHELSEDQRLQRISACTSLLSFGRIRSMRWMSDIVTSDEKWVYLKNPVRKCDWVDKGSTPQPLVSPPGHRCKVMTRV